MIIAILQGPQIRVSLHFERKRFKSSSLSFANHFECCIEGEADELLEKNLLDFLVKYGKRKPAKIDLDLGFLTPFRQKALHHLQGIPFGEVVSYGELADLIGHERAARAVGTACHFNPYPLFIPCHRVIAAGGRLGGFAQEPKMKRLLLDFENVKINE